ncbi:uncharacterized protein MELLADRAFT_69535 [Melampsora larici-populina 98AG31]|uniref:Uncharacterized protein n=1 Tax=Melampsora larici-populina (strain 98AG31 / pathotype 3-4-7) TaxID=747676 RepID=F4SB36_MELLP|nr:uncharacterized protein MELLADRAFT_69535 [Melampsora larici-populina 98AG31]EGF98143.1 hypothetical protein MELLADRAFT_69535 [Melampsora larici-populina 98AG31]
MPYDPIQSLIHEDENPDEVFDPAYLITDGDDAPARHPTLERLWRQGTESRQLMEDSQSFVIAKVVLDSELTPLLTWNASVGSKRTKLIDFKSFQDFVNNLGKSRSSKGTVHIVLEKPQVKAKKNAQASGAVAFIQGNAGPTPLEAELAASQDQVAAAQEETLRDGYTTRGIAPNTVEYKREMFKNALVHHDMNVDDRVRRRYPVASPSSKPSGSKARSHHNFFSNAPSVEVKVKVEPESPPGAKHARTSSTSGFNSQKKVKKEPSEFGLNAGKSISLLTDEDIPKSDPYVPDSDVEFVVTHATLLDDFLFECDVARNDLATRAILRKAQVTSWTDLVPSMQMTANVLTGHGMPFNLALRLINAAAEADAQNCPSTSANRYLGTLPFTEPLNLSIKMCPIETRLYFRM